MNFELSTALNALQASVWVVLLFWLVRSDLAPKYRFFAFMIGFEVVRQVASALIPRVSNVYAYFYFLTQPIQWCLALLVTLEVYRSVFRTLTGIVRLSRYVIVGAVLVALCAALLTLGIRTFEGSPFAVLELYLSVERGVSLSLLIFLAILVVFLSVYPVPVHRNALVYTGVFVLLFGVRTAALMARSILGPPAVAAVNLTVMSTAIASGLLCLFFLRPSGEERRLRTAYRKSGVEEDRLVEQLESINRSLLRSVPD